MTPPDTPKTIHPAHLLDRGLALLEHLKKTESPRVDDFEAHLVGLHARLGSPVEIAAEPEQTEG